MMRRHFMENPSDYYGAIFYGMINDRLGNTAESVRVWQTLDSLHPDNPDVALKYAEALTNRRDSLSLRKAVEVARRIERAEGPELGLTSHTVRSLLELGDTAAVFAELERFRRVSPRNSNFYIYAGDVNMVLQRPRFGHSLLRLCLRGRLDQRTGLLQARRIFQEPRRLSVL